MIERKLVGSGTVEVLRHLCLALSHQDVEDYSDSGGPQRQEGLLVCFWNRLGEDLTIMAAPGNFPQGLAYTTWSHSFPLIFIKVTIDHLTAPSLPQEVRDRGSFKN